MTKEQNFFHLTFNRAFLSLWAFLGHIAGGGGGGGGLGSVSIESPPSIVKRIVQRYHLNKDSMVGFSQKGCLPSSNFPKLRTASCGMR